MILAMAMMIPGPLWMMMMMRPHYYYYYYLKLPCCVPGIHGDVGMLVEMATAAMTVVTTRSCADVDEVRVVSKAQ
jgi:hypothetical protein